MNSLKLTLSLATAFAVALCSAQNEKQSHPQRSCGTMEHHEFLKKTRHGYQESFEKYAEQVNEYLQYNSSAKTSQQNIVVPVVIHVVYRTAGENITDNQAQTQLTVLNEDFQKLNSDTGLVPAKFKSVASGVNITFCLAQRDPNGNPTTGIIHKQTTVTTFSTDDKVKFTAQGGDDAWDVSKYVNIWICNLGGGLLGYGEFPTTSLSNTYGLVINYTCAGTTGTAQYPFNGGRTGTHEFGHCFDLYHIWGDDGSACIGSDLCSDTPNQKGENYGSPNYPLGTSVYGGCCNASDTSSMFMNYMDYVDDAAMYMFTAQQCARMYAVVSTPPYDVLQLSDGCTPVVLMSDDAGHTAIVQPTGNFCTGNITPVVTIKNWGTNTLSSAIINYQVDNGSVQTYTYTGSLASLSSTNITLPAISAGAGAHTFKAYPTLPNGVGDMNANNDTATSSFTVLSGAGLALPFSEGFEGTTFVPSGWVLNNPDNADTWMRTTAAAKTGVASARMDNYNNAFNGEIDEMMTPALDLTTIANPALTFDLAYKLYTNPTSNPNYSDTLEVLISTDCGQTWTSLYKKFGTMLATTVPYWANNAFTPTSAQWRNEAISLGSYITSNNAFIKFRNISDYENYLYIDNVNITTSTGIETEANETFAIYPNPSAGIVTVQLKNSEPVTISVTNSLGQQVTQMEKQSVNGVYNLDLSSQANGIYFIRVTKNGMNYMKKIVISR